MIKHSKKILSNFLNKSFTTFGSNSIHKPSDLKELLTRAVQSKTFIETASHMHSYISADTIFRRVEQFSYIESMRQAFDAQLRAMHKSRRKRVRLAIDTKHIAYYGKKKNFWIHNYKPDKGCTGCFEFAEASIAQGNNRYILYGKPIHIGWNKAKTVEEILNVASRYVITDLALFDRGFYAAEVIELLNSKRQKYIILVRRTELVKKLLADMQNGESKIVKHELTLNKDKSKYKVKTKLVLLKGVIGREGRKFDLCFATNLNCKPETIRLLYTRRWGIETSNRLFEDVKIKTKSTNITVRTFIFLFCCLIHNLWIWLRVRGYYMPLPVFAFHFCQDLFYSMICIEYVWPP